MGDAAEIVWTKGQRKSFKGFWDIALCYSYRAESENRTGKASSNKAALITAFQLLIYSSDKQSRQNRKKVIMVLEGSAGLLSCTGCWKTFTVVSYFKLNPEYKSSVANTVDIDNHLKSSITMSSVQSDMLALNDLTGTFKIMKGFDRVKWEAVPTLGKRI